MQNKNLKDNVLKLIELKQKTSEIIQNIYHTSQDIQLCIYDDNSVFVENPKGFETLAKIFKKRILVCENKIKGKYSIKKYFEYRGVEFFCFYKSSKNQSKKIQQVANVFGKTISVLKNIGLFIFSILKVIAK